MNEMSNCLDRRVSRDALPPDRRGRRQDAITDKDKQTPSGRVRALWTGHSPVVSWRGSTKGGPELLKIANETSTAIIP